MKRTKFSVFLTTPQPEHSENKFSSFRIFFEYPVWSVWLAFSKQAWKSSSVSPTAALWIIKWRWRDSNSWPPACKAGALPTELHPHGCGAIFDCFFISLVSSRWVRVGFRQWAWVDSNHRPHAYQACALTGWATSPSILAATCSPVPSPAKYHRPLRS